VGGVTFGNGTNLRPVAGTTVSSNLAQIFEYGVLSLRQYLKLSVAILAYVFLYGMAVRLYDASLSPGLMEAFGGGDLTQLIISSVILSLVLLIPSIGIINLLSWLPRLSMNFAIFATLLILSLLQFLFSIAPRSESFQANYRGCESFLNGQRTACVIDINFLNLAIGVGVSAIIWFGLALVTLKETR
jgi:hypothetical protein